MIFKRWFKPKWQHPDAAIRQQALETLQPTSAEHKQVLHELAFNDAAEAVRKAALHRLDDFALWWQASKHDTAERLKHYAEQQVVDQLLANRVAAPLKQKFIEQCNRSSILESLALKDADMNVRFALLQRLERPELIQQTLLDAAFPVALKQQLLSQITDEKQLEKLSKQLEPSLAETLQARLAKMAADKQKPPRLRKEITLLLAKLNALRERHTLAELPALQQELQQQWQVLAAELPLLPEQEAQGFSEKFQQLDQRLTEWLAPKLAQLQAEQALVERKARQVLKTQQLQQAVSELEQQLQVQLQQVASTEQNGLLDAAATALCEELDAAELAHAEQSALQQRLTVVQQQLARLPELNKALKSIQQLLNAFSEQPLPNSAEQLAAAEQQWQDFTDAWRSASKGFSASLPAELNEQFKQLRQQWQQALSHIKQQQQKELRQLRSKCAEYKRLHAAGRYKVLFGLYKGMTADVANLSAEAQQQFEKEFAEISSLQTELESLQQYIATPRKTALLNEMTALANSPLQDAKARAEQVKLARANWKSLGKADPAAEESLNQAFDAACEAAFEPCRQVFAQQDAERELHLQQRQQLLQELGNLVEAELPERDLDAAFRQLSQRWRESGAVNRRDYQALQQQFQELSKRLKDKVATAQQQQAAGKAALIAEAKLAMTLEDGAKTAQVLKELQQRWKTFGFAGRQQDQALWLEFRALCDSFFEKRNEEYKLQQQAEQEVAQLVSEQLATLNTTLAQATSAGALQAVQAQLRQLSLPDSVGVRQQYQELSQQLQQRQKQLQKSAHRQELQTLFDVLEQGDIKAEQLPQSYREALSLPQPSLTRSQLTIALELMSEQNVEQTSAAERQQVQLALLSLKHNAGQQLTPEQLLQQWLAHGPVAQQEKPLLKRVAALF
ncbi:MAG: DUF349 domain-containing protein [Alishewanella sp.]|nr:DUF349 domain-containing protein [Alishewanella sp.]